MNGNGSLHNTELLSAGGPETKNKDQLMLFGQFVGDWGILEDRVLGEDGKWMTYEGELHWGWILDGKAVQDVWSFSRKGETYKGSTVRFYDSSTDAWHSVWLSPTKGAVRNFVGRRKGNEIVLETTGPDGRLIHWIFYNISNNSFNWRAEECNVGETKWIVTEEMIIRRRRR